MGIIGYYLTRATGVSGKPDLNRNNYYAKARKELFRELLKRGVRSVLVYDDDIYVGGGVFGSGWEVKEDERGELCAERLNENFRIDILFDRGHFLHSDLNKINPDIMQQICCDKYLSYLFAPDYHAKTYLLEDNIQLGVLRNSYFGKKIALKELIGYAGNGVFVGKIEEYDNKLSFPIIAQEFIDTSGGIPGLAKGPHDVRVVLFNGVPVHGLLRQPPMGEFKSSTVANGGSARALFVGEIPKEIVKIAKRLDERFEVKGSRFFSVDFGWNGHEWKVFEMNSAPSLAHESVDGEAANEYTDLLARCLVKSFEEVV